MSQSLQVLLEHAESQRDAARSALQQAEQALQQLTAQCEQLQAYRGEYLARGPGLDGRAAPMALLRCHRDFLQRLDQALGQLQGQHQTTALRVEELRRALLAQETRVASVKKLMERREAEVQRGAARAEQRRSDEAALRQRRDGGPLARLWHSDAQPATY